MNAISKATHRRQPRLCFSRRFDKIVELLVHLAKIKPERDQYQAVKLFYLADKEHFNLYGRPITFETYYALDCGPVASTVLDLIKANPIALREARIDRLPITIKQRDKIYTLEKAEREPDYDVFSKSDLNVFNKVVSDYGDKSFRDLYRITHDHAAYKLAWGSKAASEQRALMFYEDMLEDSENKEDIIADLLPVARFLR